MAVDRLVAFVGSSDLDAARHFYGGLLWLELRNELPHALVATVERLAGFGNNLAFVLRA